MVKLWLEKGAWVSASARRFFKAFDLDSPARIAVIRHAALGDMVLTRPFLIELRRLIPNCKITLSIVSNYRIGVPEDLVDTVHCLSGMQRGFAGLLRRIREIRALGPQDIIFDFADTAKSRQLCLYFHFSTRVSMSYTRLVNRLYHDAFVWRSDYVFECTNMLHTLMLLGGSPRRPINYGWYETAVSPLNLADRPIFYFPFASTSRKKWDPKRWVELIDRLALDFPSTRHCIISGVGPQEDSSQFRGGLLENRQDIIFLPTLSLEQLSLCLTRGSCLVSNDTGIRNLAITLNLRTVGIFFSTVPFRYLPDSDLHVAVFRSDGAQPEVADVRAAVSGLLRPP